MTLELKQIAIAEACGWRGIPEQFLVGYAPWRTEPYADRVNACPIADLDCIPLDPLPDYFNDLNAIHEAVHSRVTSPELQQEYFYQLNDAIGLVDSFSPAWIKEFAVFAHSQATATQRAEALGKTLSLW